MRTDPDYSEAEDRYILLVTSFKLQTLIFFALDAMPAHKFA